MAERFATPLFLMNLINQMRLVFLILVGLVASTIIAAQETGSRRVTSAFAILSTAVDSKTATVGQQLAFRAAGDVMVGAVVVIPKGSTIHAYVSDVKAKGKDQPQWALAIIVDRATTPTGLEIPIQAIIAAVAAPKDNSLSSDPAYGMLHSNEPRMSGAGAGSASRTGELTASSKSDATAAVATAGLKGQMDEGFVLNETSSGAIGYEGMSLSWGLAAPPPFTIFVNKSKGIKLGVGTQVLLRMAPPRLPQ